MNLLKKVVALEHAASSFGFQWENTAQIMTQIQNECAEIQEHLVDNAGQAVNQAALQEEIGDLLHAVFSLCVFCQCDPETTLAQTLSKFEKRLNAVKAIAREQGLAELTGYPFEALMVIWKEAKRRVG